MQVMHALLGAPLYCRKAKSSADRGFIITGFRDNNIVHHSISLENNYQDFTTTISSKKPIVSYRIFISSYCKHVEMTIRETISTLIRSIPGSEKLPNNMLQVPEYKITKYPNKINESKIANSSSDSIPPSETLRKRMALRRSQVAQGEVGKKQQITSQPNTVVHSSQSGDSSNKLVDEGLWTESDSGYPKVALVDQYLNEQNDKFNRLIYNNLREVMTQEQRSEEEIKWPRLAWELVLSKNIREATERANLLAHKFSTVASSYIPIIAPKDSPQVFVEEYEAHIVQENMKRLLDHYTPEEKHAIYKELTPEFGAHATSETLSKEHLMNPDASYIDKAEALLILSIRLSFAGLRQSIPLLQRAASKFQNDEILIFNASNFHSFLSFIIVLLDKLERKVHNAGVENSNVISFDHMNNDHEQSSRGSGNLELWSNSMNKLVATPDYGFFSCTSLGVTQKDTAQNLELCSDCKKPHSRISEIFDAVEMFASELT